MVAKTGACHEYGSSSKSNTIGEIPVLRMGNIQNGKFDFNDLVYTSNSYEINKYLLECNDVLFNRTNTIDLVGKTAIYKGERPAIFAGYLIRINIKPELINSDFLNYWLNTKIAQKYGQQVLSVAVGQANINGTKLKTYPIPLPPTKAEQTAIATAISDVDALISSLEKLSVKKRNIKQGAMQKLLQPKEGWGLKSIKDISINMLQGVNTAIDIPEYVEDGIPMLKANNIIDGEVNLLTADHISSKTFQGYSDRFKIRKNDFLFSNIGARLGSGSLMKKEIECSFAWNVMRIIPNTKLVLPEYLNCIMNSPALFNEIKKNESGSGMGFIPKNVLQNLLLSIPSTMEEQTRIATILSDMDTEIEALETKLEKYRNIKLGMMQNLLTGKIRLL